MQSHPTERLIHLLLALVSGQIEGTVVIARDDALILQEIFQGDRAITIPPILPCQAEEIWNHAFANPTARDKFNATLLEMIYQVATNEEDAMAHMTATPQIAIGIMSMTKQEIYEAALFEWEEWRRENNVYDSGDAERDYVEELLDEEDRLLKEEEEARHDPNYDPYADDDDEA